MEGMSGLHSPTHSVRNWIIMRQEALVSRAADAYIKLFKEFGAECPLFEVENLLTYARIALCEKDYQSVLESLFLSAYRQYDEVQGTEIELSYDMVDSIEMRDYFMDGMK